MKVGVCYIPTMPGTWEEAIAQAGALGFHGFEVTARHPAGRTDPAAPASLLETRRIEAVRHPSSLDELLDHPERVTSLRDAARRAGVELNSVALTGFGPGFRLSDPDPAVREATVQRVKLLLQRCSELGATVLMIPVAPSVTDVPAVIRWVEAIRGLLTTAERLGISLGLETMYDSAKQREIIESLNSPWVGDYFDVGNSAAAGRDPVAEMLQRRELVVQLHVKGVRGAELDRGTVDLDGVKRAIQDIGFDRWMMLESTPGADANATAARNLATIRQHFAV
jgi:sugar phosphate isomerase/epimerase